MPVINYKRLSGIITASAVVILALYGCSGNPAKFVENAFVGTWQIDTSRVSVSVSVDAGETSDLQVFLPFITDNYQNIRLLLKEPATINVARSSLKIPIRYLFTGLFFRDVTSSCKLNVIFLFLNLSDKIRQIVSAPS